MAHLICCCCYYCSTLLVLLHLLSWRWRIAVLSLIAASPPSASCRVLLLYPSTPAVSPSSSSSAPPPPPRLPHVLLLTVCRPPPLETSCPHVSSHRRARHRSLLLLLLLFCICFPCSSSSPSSRSCSAYHIAGRAVHGQEICVPVPLSGLRSGQQRQAGGSSTPADLDAPLYAALRREGRGGQLLGCGGDRRACACATTASPLHRHLPRLPVVVGSRLLVVLLLLFSLLLSLPDRRQRQWCTDEGLPGRQQR